MRQTSDCGWMDYVQWSGWPAPVPLPTEWDQISYTYDAAGRRIEKKYDGWVVVKYLYDGDHCIAEHVIASAARQSDGNNNLLRKYIFGPGVDEPVSMIDVEHSNATYYYHFDALGSVIALTNSSGSTVELYEYSVYGQVAASDANNPNRFLFTGREFDKETGLYYYRARYYHPEIGRFLQTDPVGYGDGMNCYAYCGNEPVCSADPSGTMEEDVLCDWRERLCDECGVRFIDHYGDHGLIPAPYTSCTARASLNDLLITGDAYVGWESYEWTGEFKITNWRREAWQDELCGDVSRTGNRIIGMYKWANRFETVSKVFVIVLSGGAAGWAELAEDCALGACMAEFDACISAALDGLADLPDTFLEVGDGYRAWMKVKVFKRP